MSEHDETLTDLAATVDYIHDRVTEQADRLDFDDAYKMRDWCKAIEAEAKAAAAMIETTMLKHLEAGVQQRGSRIFKRKRNIVERFRHDLIAADLERWARLNATDDKGVTSVSKAIAGALDGMRDLYVSPSTKAKIGALDTYGMDRKKVSEREDKGWKLEVEELDARDD